MRCPTCGSSLTEDAERCGACGTVVKANPTESPAPRARIEWALLTEASWDLDAGMIQGLLESAGIPVRLASETAERVYGITSGALGGVKIYVPRERLHDALALLEAEILLEGDETGPPPDLKGD